jgi:hypothetical protein
MGYSDCCADFIFSIQEGVTEEKMQWGHPLNYSRNEVYSFAERLKDYLEGGDRYDPVCYPTEITRGLIELCEQYLSLWTQGNFSEATDCGGKSQIFPRRTPGLAGRLGIKNGRRRRLDSEASRSRGYTFLGRIR